MPASIAILLATSVFTTSLASGLLLLTWWRHRQMTALAIWGSGFALSAFGLMLIAARGHIPDLVSIVLANAAIAGGYGMLWAGVRIFEGRQVYPPLAATGAFVWFLGCLVPSIYSEPEHRARLIAVIIVSYLALTVAELWRSRGDGLWSRWPIMVVLAVHASAIPARVPLVASIYHPGPVRTDLVLLIGFDTLLVGTCATYLLGSIAVERIAGWYRDAAMIDPLTGVSNRRAFFDQGARLVRRAAFSQRTVALLMFDLDNFKRINDEFGHHVGDLVLMAFGRIATAEVRPTDLLGRIGGEEFACLLVDTTEGNARLLAERIRARVEVTPHHIATPPLYSTVSIGVATSALGDFDLLTLLHSADRALYRAKELGRNRVVTIDTTG